MKGEHQICFLNYDLKNNFESFSVKHNNPHQFPVQFFVKAEKVIESYALPTGEIPGSDNNTYDIQSCTSRADYIETVNKLKEHIQQGDIYEINFCITFEIKEAHIDPVGLYYKLNSISNAPYSCLVKLDDNYIICSSPELFLSRQDGLLITKPIKGTVKRGDTAEQDNALKHELQHSIKERTENVMIVDVARNDLSRIAKKGSVTVNELYHIESYQQVHQMVSTISCEPRDEVGFEDIIKATFPMASMTGAPKIRAMELADQYETYNRGPYSGAVGYLDDKGNFELNVLIRSIFYNSTTKYLSFSVGSAITALCNAEDEYEECLLKAKALSKVLS